MENGKDGYMDKSKAIPFGKRGDKLITIDDLGENEYQRNCNCVCPDCEQPLEAVNGEKFKYFRHQKDHEHCHFVKENYVLEYAWQLLESLGLVEGLDITVEDIRFAQILPLFSDMINKNNDVKKYKENLPIKISKVSKADKTFSIIIKDEEYKVRLIFKDKNKSINEDKLVIDLSQLEEIKKVFDGNVKDNLVKEISSRISSDILEMYKKDKLKEKDGEYIQTQDDISFDEETDISQSKKIEILRYYKKKCPLCGAPLCQVRARVGTSIICSNYPDCFGEQTALVLGKYK